ncbi:MAG: Gfo/Idh/MocA family oxidoreductase [Thiotrichales bacterium]|nr:Gfo/Idh/MocA family oxidoreductase [Thiotrichales bacterium]MBT3854013.1 Gfo/Idh/MocA family oxidoreductase [Thiotrichales bacterium]MBT4652992.1 Gfo/Idh/MocA family oxidoreductase [Thiotrichales bacterium]MBT5500052.1 Gfo/Idh/MocA family oxidoreductase [Thiotrichales bacterium]MBT5983893.1 Gfo/Idh/MocA family oxidoreductase [Thiotrichales bacterium]
MKKLVNLGVLGVGLIGKRHVEFILKSKIANLVAIADPDSSAKSYASKLGVNYFNSLDQMLASSTLDGVVIATPNNLHVSNGLECIKHGIPSLIEKPLASTAKDAEIIAQASEHSNVPVLVGHHRRYNPIIIAAKKIINSGTIGNVRSFHANCWLYKPDEYFDGSIWRTKKGAGPVSVNLVHDIDLLRYLCGEVVSVQAQTVKSKRGHENEDVAAVLVRFENDIVGTISVSDTIVSPWSWELTAKENPAYPRTTESCYFFGGEHGSLSVPDLNIWKNKDKRGWWEPISSEKHSIIGTDPLMNQIDHFVSVINGSNKPLVTANEGLRNLKVLEGIYKSAEMNQTFKIT